MAETWMGREIDTIRTLALLFLLLLHSSYSL